jgi:hypothetical protein
MRARSLLLLSLTALTPPGCKAAPADAEGTPGADSAVAEAGSGSRVTLPVVGTEVRKGDLVLSINTTGQARSQAVANLKSETSGTVAQVLV